MSEPRIEDLVMLEPAQGPEGVRAFVAWDPTLEREVMVWMLGRAPPPDVEARLERWARRQAPGLAWLHSRGRLATGDVFVVLDRPSGVPLAAYLDRHPDPDARAATLARLARTLASLEATGLAPPALAEGVVVDRDGIPTLQSVRLDCDPTPGAALRLMGELALSRAEARMLASADDLEAAALLLTPTRRPLGPAVRLALIAVLAIATGLGAAWWARRPPTLELGDPCELAGHQAARWRAGGPLPTGTAGTLLERRVDEWSSLARQTCEAGRREELSRPLVQARGQCLEEQLAALGGIREALLGHEAVPVDRLMAAMASAGPPDTCAWGPEEGYLYRTRAARPASDGQIAAVARTHALTMLEPSPEAALDAATLTGVAPPRWAAWRADVDAHLAADDVAWRRASWRRVTLHMEAGDNLGAVDALLDRAEAGRGPPVVRETALRLADAWLERIPTQLLGSPRAIAWVEPRRERLRSLQRDAP